MDNLLNTPFYASSSSEKIAENAPYAGEMWLRWFIWSHSISIGTLDTVIGIVASIDGKLTANNISTSSPSGRSSSYTCKNHTFSRPGIYQLCSTGNPKRVYRHTFGTQFLHLPIHTQHLCVDTKEPWHCTYTMHTHKNPPRPIRGRPLDSPHCYLWHSGAH